MAQKIRFKTPEALANKIHTIESLQSSEQPPETFIHVWKYKYNFVIICISNLYNTRSFAKFAKYCIKYGGVNFILAYLFVTITLGVPILFSEILLGQYTGHSSYRSFSIVRCMNGISFSHLFINGITTISSLVSTSQALVFMIGSLELPIEWSHCNNTWNDNKCIPVLDNSRKSESLYVRSNLQQITYIITIMEKVNGTIEFLDFRKLHIHNSHPLVLYLITVTIIYISIEMMKMKFMDYISPIFVAYVLVMILILIMLGVTLRGAGNGLKKLILPKMKQLLKMNFWCDVAEEVLFTYSIGFGCIITMSSYCTINSNIQKNLWFIVMLEFIMCFTGSIAAMEFIGAFEIMFNYNYLDVERSQVLYLLFTSVLMKFPYYNLLAFGAFLLIFCQIINAQIVNVEVLNLCFIELLNIKNNKYLEKLFRSIIYLTAFGICLALFILNLDFYMLTIFNEYCLFNCPIIIALFQVITLSYFYGIPELNKLYQEINFKSIPLWIKFCLLFTCPVMLSLVLLAKCFKNHNFAYQYYSVKLKFPWFSDYIGLVLNAIIILPIPIYFIYTIVYIKIENNHLTFLQCLKIGIRPNTIIYQYK